MIGFGPWSITLALASLHGLIVAALLVRTTRNRIANRCLAALLLLVVLLITPYTIGYAGFYDAWPWLTFAPFYWQLGFGPLIWLYVRQLGHTALPRRWAWHCVPLALQVAYYAALFVQPMDVKQAWNHSGHVPWVLPLQNLAIILSLALYLALAAHRYAAYQAWLDAHSGRREEFRLSWLRVFLTATAVTVLIALGFGLFNVFVRPLSYFDEFPLYLVFCALVYGLGLGGWRHADATYPAVDWTLPELPLSEPPLPDPTMDRSRPTSLPQKNWRLLGERYRARFQQAGWWREPAIDLAEAARRLGTNANYLSRALNEGLGQSFSEFVNRQRVAAAQQRLGEAGDVLAIALEVGFGSKASFNRVFKDCTGCTPSEWRRSAAAARPIS